VARFDGKGWRRLESGVVEGKLEHLPRWPLDREGESMAARALVSSGNGLWAGTPRGLWPIWAARAPIDRTSGLIDDDVVHLAADRFGRIWVLGRLGLTIRRPL
jgi:ligand-binding sensor domain-containing protein